MQVTQWIGIVCAFVCLSANAMMCPAPDHVRLGKLKGWRVVSDDTHRALRDKERFLVTKEARHFRLAEWEEAHAHVRCFYQNAKNEHLHFYLEKKQMNPVREAQKWYVAGEKGSHLHCSAKEALCQFVG